MSHVDGNSNRIKFTRLAGECFKLEMFSIRINCNKPVYNYVRYQLYRQFSTERKNNFPRNKKKSQVITDKDGFHNNVEELQHLSTTKEWRRVANNLLNENEKIHCDRSSLPMYNNLAAKAFYDAELVIGWEMLERMNASHFQPHCSTFQAYWDFCALNKDTFVENVEKMFEFIAKHDVIVSKNVIDDLIPKIQHFGGTTVTNRINHEGVCQNCQQQLKRLHQSSLDFHTLKREFENVIVKPKIPSIQLNVFRQMVNKKKTYNYIIDSLNVTRTARDTKGNICKQGRILEQVVEQLKLHDKKLLIVGKKHVNEWPERSTNFIRRNATVFLSNHTVAIDDIFMMYAAMISGERSHFVTNDLLTNYADELSESGRQLFRNWQKQHQHWVVHDDEAQLARINRPRRFTCNANKSTEDGRWHIPFTINPLLRSLRGLITVPIEWACIELKNK